MAIDFDGQVMLLMCSWARVITPSAALMYLTSPTPLWVVVAGFLLIPISFMSIDFISIDFMSMLFGSIAFGSFLFMSLDCARTPFGMTTLRAINRLRVAICFIVNPLRCDVGWSVRASRRHRPS